MPIIGVKGNQRRHIIASHVELALHTMSDGAENGWKRQD